MRGRRNKNKIKEQKRKEEVEGKVTVGPEQASWPEAKGAEPPEEEPGLPLHFPAPIAPLPLLPLPGSSREVSP